MAVAESRQAADGELDPEATRLVNLGEPFGGQGQRLPIPLEVGVKEPIGERGVADV
jgi:hypothetical protein